MRPLGRVIKISSSGKALVKAHEVPEIGVEVYDENMRIIGYVQDVIGPVKGPYISVKLYEDKVNVSYFKNKLLYYKEKPRRGIKGLRR